jgi:hypothetical protein
MRFRWIFLVLAYVVLFLVTVTLLCRGAHLESPYAFSIF